MPVHPQYLAYVLEQLAALPALRPNRMFGGIGLYSDGLFFGLIDDDILYFKTGEGNLADYRARNMPKFMPFPEKTRQETGYHQVPADVIEDAEQLVAWAQKSKVAALEKRNAKAKRVKSRVAVSGKSSTSTQSTSKKGAGKKTAGKKAAGKKSARKKPARRK